MSNEPPSFVIAVLEAEPEYVLGFPIYVAVTVAVDRPGAALNRLPYALTHELYGAIGLRLWRNGETEPFLSTTPSAVADPHLGMPMFRLGPGEERRMLLEISPLLPESLAPGDYAAALLYGDREEHAESRFRLRLRAPTQPEQELLTALQPELSAAGSWGQWAEQRRPSAVVPGPATHPGDLLRYPRALKYMLYGSVPLGAVDDGFLALLDGVFAPDAEGFRGEILAAKDPLAFAAHAQQVRAKWPGLSTWLDHISNGTSAIAWARTQG
jgi:hypothetical protein